MVPSARLISSSAPATPLPGSGWSALCTGVSGPRVTRPASTPTGPVDSPAVAMRLEAPSREQEVISRAATAAEVAHRRSVAGRVFIYAIFAFLPTGERATEAALSFDPDNSLANLRLSSECVETDDRLPVTARVGVHSREPEA